MLWKGHEIAGIRTVKGYERHGCLGGKTHGLIIHPGNAFHMVCPFFYKPVVAHAFKYIIHHSRVSDDRAAQPESRVHHVVRSDRSPVGPYGLIINVHQEISLVLSCHGISQHSLKFHVLVQFHQGQEHKTCCIFIHLHAVHQQGIQRIERAGHSDIDNLPAASGR